MESADLLPESAETARKTRLIHSFALLGLVFGCLYGAFYFSIGHRWGTLVIALCTGALGLAPVVSRKWGIAPAANLICFILIAGFIALDSMEGGLHGHAIAWLVSIPLCALLLAGERSARVWSLVCLLAAALFTGLEFSGIAVPVLYAKRWDTLVTGAGYLGLIVFMFILGLIFERGRARANRAMRAALAELEEANGDLRRLNVEKNEFLGIAAHDLKNPLSAVAGYAELIRNNMTTGKGDTIECSERIIEATYQMIDLITNLLDVNAIEEGKLRLDLQRCDLGEIAAKIVDTYRGPAAKKQIPIRWSYPVAPPLVRADPRLTSQILDNLVSNAVKYSYIGGAAITIRIAERDGGWALDVADQGPGLSAEDQTKLFGKFARLTARPTGGESSTGLGLSIVRRMAREMGGNVSCRSVLGEGSTFSVVLPRWGE